MNESQSDYGDDEKVENPLDKYNENLKEGRDSTDTLELLRGSTDVSENNLLDNVLEDEDDDDTLSNKSYQNDQIQVDEVAADGVSIASSSLNIANKLVPLDYETGQTPSADQVPPVRLNDENDDEVETEDLMHLEPKLRDAWIKMRQLDKKLARAMKRERQVKLETIKLIEKNRADLERLKYTTDHKESKLEAQNTAHFLALPYVPDLDEEIERDISSGEPLTTPLFKTQLPDDQSSTRSSASIRSQSPVDQKPPLPQIATSSTTKINSNQKKVNGNSTTTKKTKETTDQKNFIRRNIELAQEAGGTLAMTDEEKQRLNELLLDMDNNFMTQSSKEETSDVGADGSLTVVDYNPYSVQLIQGEGFTPDHIESDRLRHIDTVLENRRSNLSIVSRYSSMTNNHTTSNSKLSSSAIPNHIVDSEVYSNLTNDQAKQIKLDDEFDENQFGDKFIREVRVTREQETRLKFIETELEKLKAIQPPSNDSSSVSSNMYLDQTSDSRSNSTVSLINQDQLKALIEEFKLENQIVPLSHKKKLTTLNEEEDSSVNDENNNYQFQNQLEIYSATPVLDEGTINSLIDQAKNEGIVALVQNDQMSHRTEDSAATERSFYEEALQIINSRPIINIPQLDQDLEPQEYSDKMPEQSIVDSTPSKTQPLILPPLASTINIQQSLDEAQELNQNSRCSSASSVRTTTSSVVFPKIESRFLPK